MIMWLASGLVRKGHYVHVFTAVFDKSLWDGLQPEIAVTELGTQGLVPKPEHWRKQGEQLAPLLSGFDVVNVHNFPASIWTYYARENSVSSGVWRCVWYCHEPPRHLYRDITDRYCKVQEIRSAALDEQRQLDRLAVSTLDLILTNSAFTKDNVLRVYGRTSRVCYPGIPDRPGSRNRKPGSLRVVTRLTKEKNVTSVIEALALARRRYPVCADLKLEIAGVGPCAHMLDCLVQELGMQEHVQFVGAIPDETLGTFLSHALAVPYLPLDEPFGLVLLEAMYHGIPVIGPNCGGPMEIVSHARTGFLVDPLSKEQIACAMAELAAHPGLREQMGDLARAEVMARFNLAGFIDRFEQELAGLVSGTEAPATVHAAWWMHWPRMGWSKWGAESWKVFSQTEPFDPEKWAAVWNKAPFCVFLDLQADGVPVKHMVSLLSLLDPNIRVAISSSSPRLVTELLQAFPPQRCVSLTLSYDPCFNVSPYDTLAAALAACARGFVTTVNIIACPYHMHLIPDLLSLFDRKGLRLHVDPYVMPAGGPPHSYTGEELRLLYKFVSDDRKEYLAPRMMPCTCTAGSNHVVVLPNGDVYPCTARYFDNAQKIGNLFSGNVKLFNEPIFCDMSRCIPPDVDHVQRRTRPHEQ